MIYLVSATVDDLSRVSGIRRGEKEALQLALSYHRQGYKEIRVEVEDAVYSLEQFRHLVE
jgi:hypothetical protein